MGSVATPMTFSARRQLQERATTALAILRPMGVEILELSPGNYLIDGRAELNAAISYWNDRKTGKQGSGIANLIALLSKNEAVANEDLPDVATG